MTVDEAIADLREWAADPRSDIPEPRLEIIRIAEAFIGLPSCPARKAAIDLLSSISCFSCGELDSVCQCWNDE